jgi:DNA-binding transcriptional ArsR family regulator
MARPRKIDVLEAVLALGALAQEARLAIFRLLVETGPEGVPAGEIGRTLKIPPATLTFHLQQLNHAGLITARRSGRHLIQSAAYDRMDGLIAFLTDNCCGGNPTACMPKGSTSGESCGPATETARATKRARTART